MVDKFLQGFAKLLQRVEEQERGERRLGFEVQCPSPPLPIYIGSRVAKKGCLSLQVQPEREKTYPQVLSLFLNGKDIISLI
jgi:hypothetical protein